MSFFYKENWRSPLRHLSSIHHINFTQADQCFLAWFLITLLACAWLSEFAIFFLILMKVALPLAGLVLPLDKLVLSRRKLIPLLAKLPLPLQKCAFPLANLAIFLARLAVGLESNSNYRYTTSPRIASKILQPPSLLIETLGFLVILDRKPSRQWIWVEEAQKRAEFQTAWSGAMMTLPPGDRPQELVTDTTNLQQDRRRSSAKSDLYGLSPHLRPDYHPPSPGDRPQGVVSDAPNLQQERRPSAYSNWSEEL